MTDTATHPKIELHCHLEATLTPGFIDDLATRHDRPDLRLDACQAYTAGRDLAG